MRPLACLALVVAFAACPPQPTPEDGGTGGGEATGGGSTGGGGGVTGGGAGGGGGGSITTVPPRYDGGATVELAAFCAGWADAYCTRERECRFLEPAQEATCLGRARTECSAWQRRADAGVYAYTPALGAACIDATGNRSCNQGKGFSSAALVFDLASECTVLFEGAGTSGTPCEVAAECAAGFVCAGGDAGCRACAALPRTGESCDPVNLPCHLSFCGDAGSCVALQPLGGTCLLSAECDLTVSRGCSSTATTDAGMRSCLAKDPDGTPCSADAACAAGYCNNAPRADAGVRRCGFIAVGQPCGLVGDCGPSAFCDGLTMRSVGTCAPRLALGAACRIQRSADLSDGCPEGAACFDGTCKRPRADQLTGQQCRDVVLDCVRGAWCPQLPNDGGYPTCLVQGDVGAPCSSSTQCQPGLRCTNNTCERLAAAGERCFAGQQCKDLLTCPLVDAGLGFFACAPLVPPGGSCSASGATCGTELGEVGLCVSDGGSGTCRALLAEDEACSSGTQCASRRCLAEDGGVVVPPFVGRCNPACLP